LIYLFNHILSVGNYHTKYQFDRPTYVSLAAPITCQDSEAGVSQEG